MAFFRRTAGFCAARVPDGLCQFPLNFWGINPENMQEFKLKKKIRDGYDVPPQTQPTFLMAWRKYTAKSDSKIESNQIKQCKRPDKKKLPDYLSAKLIKLGGSYSSCVYTWEANQININMRCVHVFQAAVVTSLTTRPREDETEL